MFILFVSVNRNWTANVICNLLWIKVSLQRSYWRWTVDTQLVTLQVTLQVIVFNYENEHASACAQGYTRYKWKYFSCTLLRAWGWYNKSSWLSVFLSVRLMHAEVCATCVYPACYSKALWQVLSVADYNMCCDRLLFNFFTNVFNDSSIANAKLIVLSRKWNVI